MKDKYTDEIRIKKFFSSKKQTKTWDYRYEYVLYDLIEKEEIISGKLSEMPFNYGIPRKIVWSKDDSKVYISFYSSPKMNSDMMISVFDLEKEEFDLIPDKVPKGKIYNSIDFKL